MSVDSELIADFLSAAKTYGKCLAEADSRAANKQHTVMTRLMKKISNVGQDSNLLAHVRDEDKYIRLCVASFLAKAYPVECQPILVDLESSGGPTAISARMLLDLLKTGRL